jgi:ElaB/YqjD/DUF883 family membrane-anchored ribosome-binding protein
MTDWEDRPTGGDAAAEAAASGDPEVEQLVEDIDVTREEMSSTVEQIGDRLDPRNIVADAKETVREATVGKVENMANTAGEMVSNAGQTAQQAGGGLVETIRRNPVPAAMVGIGLGWLAMSARSSSDRWSDERTVRSGSAGYRGGAWDTSTMGGDQWTSRPSGGQGIGDRIGQVGDSAGQAVSGVQDRAGEAVSQVQDRAGQVADQVGQTAGQVQYQAQGFARQVGDNAGRMFQDNPLAMGAIAVAVGTAVGMALPSTPIERKVIGGPAGEALGKAEEAASQALGQVEQTARDAEQQARQQEMESRPH